MTRYLMLNCNMMYFFSAEMGKILGITEGEPINVHSGLIKMVKNAYKIMDEQLGGINLGVQPGIQVNSRDFYLNDTEQLKIITKLYENTFNSKYPVHLSVHQMNDMQPLKENKRFYSELERSIYFATIWKVPNITVHLPVRKENDINEVMDVFTSEKIVELIEKTNKIFPVSIDLENNHHESYFGNLNYCTEFMDNLYDKFDELGLLNLKRNFNFCFDFGYFATQSYFMKYNKKKMLETFFEKNKKRIKTLHLHKNDGIGKDQHIILGATPDNTNKIGRIKVNPSILQENEELLFEMLPILKLKEQDNWVIVEEVQSVYNSKSLAKSFKLILSHL